MKTSVGDRWAWPLFLILAYGITWVVQIPAYLYLVPRGVTPTDETNFLLLGEVATGRLEPSIAWTIVLLCFSFDPSVAGVAVPALMSGWQGIRDLGQRLVRIRIPAKWVAFILLFPITLSVTAVVVGTVLGGMSLPRYNFFVPLALAIPFLLFLIICTGLAEELGWHGYANAWQSYLVLSSGNFIIQMAYGVLPWVVAVWLLKHYDSKTLTKRISRVPEAA